MKKKALLMIALLLTFVQCTWAENVTFNERTGGLSPCEFTLRLI